ncbi:Replication protein O [Burkholderia alba]|uniref:Replication protein O n=1 Tax=Burkholderia alba TaxID=2683677 RepID=UPI002B05D3A3|nr:Replication protein O [Burkholderia alba]
MSIAQSPIAGEGDIRPSNNEAALVAAFSSDPTNLPWRIFRAVHRANQIPELPGRARTLLAALARTVDQNAPFAAIYARRELLTGRALQSVRSFYRSLVDLEAAGLIVRTTQTRYVEVGKFGRTYIHLTPAAAQLLGLVEAPIEHAGQVADGLIEECAQTPPDHVNATPDFSLASPNASVAHGAIYENLSPSSFQKRQPGQLPADLIRLRSLGFHKFLIFKLMREARLQGKFLSDVVAATWDHLKLARCPINYLRSLLGRPVDYRHLRTTQQAKADTIQVAAKQAEQVADAVARHAGQSFYDRTATQRVTLSTDGAVLTSLAIDERAPRTSTAQWQAAWYEAVQRGRLVPATPGLEEQFSTQRQARVMTLVAATSAVADTHSRADRASGAQHMATLRALTRQWVMGAGGGRVIV